MFKRVERHLKCIDRGGEYFKKALSMYIFAKFLINVHDVVRHFRRAPRFRSIGYNKYCIFDKVVPNRLKLGIVM